MEHRDSLNYTTWQTSSKCSQKATMLIFWNFFFFSRKFKVYLKWSIICLITYQKSEDTQGRRCLPACLQPCSDGSDREGWTKAQRGGSLIVSLCNWYYDFLWCPPQTSIIKWLFIIFVYFTSTYLCRS